MPAAQTRKGAAPVTHLEPVPGTASLEVSFLTSVFAELSGRPADMHKSSYRPAGRAIAAEGDAARPSEGG
jgi:hypothetical protein